MNIETTGLIYFSPTGTTKKVVEGIAEGLDTVAKRHFDLTQPEAIALTTQDIDQDLAIIGAPVYGGRLPSVMLSRFKKINGNGRPAVIVVVYGNRAFDDALIELRDVACEAGFKPIAGGAFIGVHSYSTTELPIAAGRPDADDIAKAHAFGKAIHEKLMAATSLPSELLGLPGNYPYKITRLLSGLAPSVNEALCLTCGKCLLACPTAAIGKGNPVTTEKDSCIRCCACVKVCPSKVRILDAPEISQAAEWLYANFSTRSEPETYL